MDKGGPMVIIMVKAPVPGHVKSRLAASIGDEAAASVYRSIAGQTVRSLVEAGIPLTMAYLPPGGEAMIREAFGDGIPLLPQVGSDLGERLANAFRSVLRYHPCAVAVSSDVPELDAPTVSKAIAALETSDAVLGPCPDGGFYLIGFNASSFREEAFEGVPWSTEDAAVSMLWKLKGLHVSLLPELADIDTEEDLKEYERRSKDG